MTPDGEDWVFALERLRGAYADSTLSRCLEQFGLFEAWCRETGRAAVPPTAEAVVAYIDPLYARRSARTVMTALYAIRKVAAALGLPDPTLDPAVRLAVRRGKRLYGAPPRQAPPIDAALRDRLRAACPCSLLGLRDRALLALGYDTLCRRSELVRLRVEDFEPLPEGGGRIAVRNAKTSPDAPMEWAFVSARTVADLADWLRAADLIEGPILRRVYGPRVDGQAIEPRGVNERVRAMARQAGVERAIADRLSSHSLRVGAVQDLVRAGFSVLEIMRAGRWRHVERVAQYARHTPVNVFAQMEGDTYALAARVQLWRRRAFAARRRPRGGRSLDNPERL